MKCLFRLSFLVALLLGAAQSVYSQSGTCQQGLGGRVFATGAATEVEIRPHEAVFTDEIYLISPKPTRFIGLNTEEGKIVSLGTFSAGTELVFGIFVRNTGASFRMGTDRAFVHCLGNGVANVNFEDSDDADYDDAVIQIRPAQTSVSVERRPPFDFSQQCNARNAVDNSSATVRSNTQGSLSVDVSARAFGTVTGRAGAGIVYNPGNYSGPIRITAEVQLRRDSFDQLMLLPLPFQFGAVSIDSDIFLRAEASTTSPVTGINRFRSKTLNSINPIPQVQNFRVINRYSDAPTIPVDLNTSVVAGRPLLICAGVQSRAGSLSALLVGDSSRGMYDADVLNIKVAPR